MKTKHISIIGGIIALCGIIPAAGPVYLGLVRDDIHAHSRMGDLGLQAITISGVLIVVLGLVLVASSGKRLISGKDGP